MQRPGEKWDSVQFGKSRYEGKMTAGRRKAFRFRGGFHDTICLKYLEVNCNLLIDWTEYKLLQVTFGITENNPRYMIRKEIGINKTET